MSSGPQVGGSAEAAGSWEGMESMETWQKSHCHVWLSESTPKIKRAMVKWSLKIFLIKSALLGCPWLTNHTSGQTCYIVVRSCSIMLHSTMAYSCFMRRIRCTSEYLPGIRRGKNCPLPRFITWGNNRVCVYTVHVCIYDYKYMQHVYIVIDVIDICTYFEVAQVTHWSSFSFWCPSSSYC